MLLKLDGLDTGAGGILARILSTSAATVNAPRVEVGVDLTVTYFSDHQVTRLRAEVMNGLEKNKPLKAHTAIHSLMAELKRSEQLFVIEELNEMTVVSDGHSREFAMVWELYDELSHAEEALSLKKMNFSIGMGLLRRPTESTPAI